MPTVLVPIGDGRSLLYIAGQVSILDGQRLTGRCPDEVSVEEAQKAARACGINLLAQMEAAAGLSNVERVAQLIGVCSVDAGIRRSSQGHQRRIRPPDRGPWRGGQALASSAGSQLASVLRHGRDRGGGSCPRPLNRSRLRARRPRLLLVGSIVYLALIFGVMLWRGVSIEPEWVLLVLLVIAVALGRGRTFIADWTPFLLLFFAYEAMRGFAAKTNFQPHDFSGLERWVFGGAIPTLVLQHDVLSPWGGRPAGRHRDDLLLHALRAADRRRFRVLGHQPRVLLAFRRSSSAS